jgi:NAD-dependent deacetylase
MNMSDSGGHKKLAEMIIQSEEVLVLSGAGISTGSGIPDFRSSTGLWEKNRPEEVLTLSIFKNNPEIFWKFYKQTLDTDHEFEPNSGHQLVYEIEKLGKLKAVITQNIDGLHHKSGVPENKILEIHGSVNQLNCFDCHQSISRQQAGIRYLNSKDGIPRCDCGGVIKPGVILFQEKLSEEVYSKCRAALKMNRTDLLIIIGSSLVVEPVASMPKRAIRSGYKAKLAVINREPTHYGRFCSVWLNRDISEESAKVVKQLNDLISE